MSRQSQPVAEHGKLQQECLKLTDGLGQQLRRAQAVAFALNRTSLVDEGNDPELQEHTSTHHPRACSSVG